MSKLKVGSSLSRRRVVQSLGASLLLSATPSRLLFAAEALRFNFDPFALGVASGSPTATSVVLWTRLMLAKSDAADNVAMPEWAVPVNWEIASDEKMRSIVRRGTHYATSEWAHAAHVEVAGLKPGRDYWYRFTAGGQRSVIGRTRTAPALNATNSRLRLAIASCQKYENGFYVAYRHMLDDDLDLIVHVGDYIYEGTGGNDLVRGDGSSEAFTLEQYRARYALYKSDLDLQAAHAAYPWLLTWDDHEVANDYSGDTPEDERSIESFLARRAAAYKAYYEHMPLPRSAMPAGPHMRLHARMDFGRLGQICMLDSRQYRSPPACLAPEDRNGPGARCAQLFDATRTKLGKEQESWVSQQLRTSRARWNILAQGTPMAHVDLQPGDGVAYRRDVWDGYPAARQRLLDTLVETNARNPIVVDGDIHTFQVASLNRQANDLNTPAIASEFTTSSISSPGVPRQRLEQRRKDNPNLLLSDGAYRGYLLLDVTEERLRADLVTMETVKQPESPRGVLASYVVEDGRAGPISA